MKHLFYCKACKKYTLKENCSNCQKPTENPIPPRYSPEDKYAKYRRQYKLENPEKDE